MNQLKRWKIKLCKEYYNLYDLHSVLCSEHLNARSHRKEALLSSFCAAVNAIYCRFHETSFLLPTNLFQECFLNKNLGNGLLKLYNKNRDKACFTGGNNSSYRLVISQRFFVMSLGWFKSGKNDKLDILLLCRLDSESFGKWCL